MTDTQPTPAYGPELLADLQRGVVGRTREAELVVAGLMAGRHLLLEGPPGTGKSTLLRTVAESVSQPLEFVEGNADLTPARLAGHFDPAQVLEAGYTESVWIDGPLVQALRDGRILYLEEINRVPEETLNLLVTVMSEGELTIPRLGLVPAHPSFRLVAAMNPFDAVGTARISGAIYDRVCRIAMGYQSQDDEVDIASRHSELPLPYLTKVVEVVRATRDHSEIRVGSSVRGAIDQLLLADQLGRLRNRAATDYDVGLDAALSALSGRVRLHDSATVTAETIIEGLWASAFAETSPDEPGQSDGDSGGKAPRRQANQAATTIAS